MHNQSLSRQYQYNPKTHIRQRPLHSFIILLSFLFLFLLFIESAAFIILGAWHLFIPRLQKVFDLSIDIYRRELGFGILLVITGSLAIIITLLGFVAFCTLRLTLLRILSLCLWIVMIVGIAVGIIGIIFASQVDGLMLSSTNSNVNSSNYNEEKFMLGMNGGLSLLMSLTLIVGIVMVRCLTGDVSSYTDGHLHVRVK